MDEARLPLFPLPTHILPGGRLPLRIFEPRYVRMVKECCEHGRDFGVVMVAPIDDGLHGQILPIGTRVRIIDFDRLENELLGITIEGQQKFEIISIDAEFDGLNVGQVTYLPNWPAELIPDERKFIANKLAEIYNEYPGLNQLYQDKELTNLSWVCQRWIEILPVTAHAKQSMIAELDCHKAELLLNQIIGH
jgi:Lon protease-like protein